MYLPRRSPMSKARLTTCPYLNCYQKGVPGKRGHDPFYCHDRRGGSLEPLGLPYINGSITEEELKYLEHPGPLPYQISREELILTEGTAGSPDEGTGSQMSTKGWKLLEAAFPSWILCPPPRCKWQVNLSGGPISSFFQPVSCILIFDRPPQTLWTDFKLSCIERLYRIAMNDWWMSPSCQDPWCPKKRRHGWVYFKDVFDGIALIHGTKISWGLQSSSWLVLQHVARREWVMHGIIQDKHLMPKNWWGHSIVPVSLAARHRGFFPGAFTSYKAILQAEGGIWPADDIPACRQKDVRRIELGPDRPVSEQDLQLADTIVFNLFLPKTKSSSIFLHRSDWFLHPEDVINSIQRIYGFKNSRRYW